jgi:predicted Zn finger-like uncharacterized protein
MSVDRTAKNPSRVLRDNLESIAVAIVLALIIRQLVGEAFKIPTGSMAPTLLGVHHEVLCPNCRFPYEVGIREIDLTGGVVECPNCHHVWPGASSECGGGGTVRMRRPAWLWNQGTCSTSRAVMRGSAGANRVRRGGSRIIVSKLSYRLFGQPRRWQVVVFLYPTLKGECDACGWEWEGTKMNEKCPRCESRRIRIQRRNFIKRLAGLPGERIQIIDGDLYADGRLARKPDDVQRQLWMHVFDSLYWPEALAPWAWPQGRVFATDGRWWQGEGGVWTVNAADAPSGEALAEFGRRITDHYGYDAVSSEATQARLDLSGTYRVDDLRLRTDFVPLSAGEVLLVLEGRDGRFTASFPVGEEAGRTARLSWLGREETREATADVGPRALGMPAAAELWLGERQATLWLGERRIARIDLGAERPADRDAYRQAQRVAFGARRARVRFERVRIARDIYYTPGGRNFDEELQVRPGHYVFLGDNSPDSNDSRAWDEPQVPGSFVAGRAFMAFWPVHEGRWLPSAEGP